MGYEETLDKAVAAMQYYIDYYKGIDEIIRETSMTQECDICHGYGETYCTHKTHNRHGYAFVPERCRKVCETCKGDGRFPVVLVAV